MRLFEILAIQLPCEVTDSDAGLSVAAGAPADPAGGEEEDDGDGRSRGEERRSAGSVQRALGLPLQAGTCAFII